MEAAAAVPRPELGWAILELMGHRRMAGWLSEVSVAGATLLRIDVPASEQLGDEERTATQMYAAGAIYCITPTTEAIARRVAAESRPLPPARRIGDTSSADGVDDEYSVCQLTEYCDLAPGHFGDCGPEAADDEDLDDDPDDEVEDPS